MPAVLLALFAAVALYEFGAAFLPLYAHRGQHRQLSPAARLRQMRARRVHGIRVHQPIAPRLLADDDALIEAAAAAARLDRADLYAGLAAICR
jgi:hypothetical protein